MSKAKKIISMLLAVVMVLSVAPLNLLATAAVDGISYQEATFSGGGGAFTVDTSATTEVVRVAHAKGMFTLGTTIVPATRSGIPETSGTYRNVAYAGETPETPKLVFTINGVRPDETPTKNCSVGSVQYGEVETSQNGSSYTYAWPLSGSAEAHSDLVFTITYKVSGTTYTAYAFSHVENILIMNGVVSYRYNNNGSKGKGRDSSIVQVQSHNMYSSMCQDSNPGNRTVGFINYGTAQALSGNALLGCGSETDLDGSINAYGAAVGVGIDGTKQGALIKVVKETTGTQRNCIYNNDMNRGESQVYLDKRTDTSLEAINLRVTLQNAEASDFGSSKFETFGIYHGHKTYGDEEANSSLTGDATSSVIAVKTHAATGSNTITNANSYGHVMTTLTGSGPSESTTATFNSTTGEYQYSFVFGLWSENGDRTNRTAVGYNIDFVVYDTTDLYNLYHGIMGGTGSYTIQNTTTTKYDTNGDGAPDTRDWAGTPISFNKGVNPQASMFESNPTAWNNFLAAYQAAGKLLVEPDIGSNWSYTNNTNVDSTTNKSATAQEEIDNAAYELVVAYQALPAYYYNVDGYVNHVYKDEDDNENLLGQQVYHDNLAGATMLAKHATIPGYEVIDATPQTKLLSGANESESITFYYKRAIRQLVLVTNNDAGDITYSDQSAGGTVAYSSLNYGTKANFDFSHWTDDNGTVIKSDFTMPNSNYTLVGNWIPSEIKISAIPVIDGVERTDLVENYTPIRPNADGSATPMARPADLVRDGYIFVEYYADKELTTLMTWPKDFHLHDALEYTFYARMVDVNGKIIYETNGGSAVNDSTFTAGQTVDPPANPTKKGYSFAGWYMDKDLTDPVETADWYRPTNTGFIAYAKWEANDYTISFDIGKTSTRYDTKEVREISGPADEVIDKLDYPEVPLKFGYIFDGWMLNGKRYDFEEGVTKYPTENITLEAIWRSTEYSAFADITAYEKLSGDYVETDSACAGDIVTFRMSTQTNFYTGSSVFVFMYDSNFFELVEEGTAAFAVNENSEYISGIDAKIQGVTNDASLPWPEFERTVTKDDNTTAYYKAMMVAIDPTVSTGNFNCEPMSDGEWIVEFKLRVRDDATGSGKVFMDNAWTRNQDNIMGTMFYGWAENKNTSVADTQNNVVTPFLQDATATITLDEEIPEDVTIIVNANGGSWADGDVEKEFTGRTETEIVGYVSPTREGYTLTVDETTGKTVWYNTDDSSDVWAEGYYGKESQQGLTYEAQWTPNPYDINFYVDGELKRVETVGYETSLADLTYTPTAKQGYKFGGWADAEENGNIIDFSTATCPLGGMNVYAVWEPATDTPFKIIARYVSNASTGAQGSATGNFTGTTGYTVAIVESVPATPAADTIYITLDMLPVAAGGNFIFDPDNNTLPVTGVVAADGSLVLEVNYTGRPTAFTFNANGGSWADGSTTYVENGTFMGISNGPATNPTRAGYEFNSWSPAYTAGTTTFNADRTFNAQWTAKKYPVTFNAVNSTISGAFADGSTTTTSEFEFGKAITAPADPSLDGYRFLGWAAADNATQAESLGTMDDENGKTFYAVYAPIEYFVNYEITWGGNYETFSDGPFYKGNTVTLRTPDNKTGYTFDGWTIGGAAAEATVTIGTSDVDVFGTYTAVNVPVYFDANGGFFDGDTAVTEKTVEVAYETAINRPSFTPARAGYEFLGWAETTDATSGITNFGYVESLTEEIRFFAVWKATYAAYTINIYMQDTTGAYPATPDQVIDTNTGLVGTEVSYAPTDKTGFTFDAANSVISGTVIGDGSLVLTVKYTRNKYEVKWIDYDSSVIRTDSVYYGAAISAPEVSREGYEFKGWTESVAATMPAYNLEYTAVYEVNYYDATFNANGGTFTSNSSATKTVPVAFGTAIEAPLDATKEGHTLLGWAYAGTTDIVISVDSATTVNMVVGGVAFDAIWEVNEYELNYRAYSGIHETFMVAFGTPAAEMPVPATDPTRTGYYFDGWRDALPETMPADTVNIQPKWAKESYTFKFDTAGGTTIADATVEYGATYKVPANPTKTGYTFAGWDGTIPTTIGDLGENGTVITFTASWTVNQYTITFANTGDTTIPAITQDYNTAVTAPADPTKAGYTFAGWDKEIPANMPAENVTITASWTINQYTITFENTGDAKIPAITQDYNTAVTAPADPTKTGYTFAGWDKAVPTVMPSKDTTITANWTINQYTITFVDTGDVAYEAITQDYNTAISAVADPVKAGYTFAGWDKEIPANMPAENLTITASWTINKNNITWTIDGATYQVDENVEYGAAITAPVPTKTGYVFSGWAEQIPATMPDAPLTFTGSWIPATDTKYTVNIHTMDTDGTYVTAKDSSVGTTGSTVNAVYTVEEGFVFNAEKSTESGVVAADGSLVLDVYIDRKTITITFANTGDSNTEAISGLYGAAVTAPADPTKTGYTFTGWDKEIPATIPAEDITVTASWEINTYTVEFLNADDSVFETFTLEYNAEIAAPASEPTKANYTFEGWSLTKITEILNPEDLADVALIDFENAAPTVPVDGLTIYPVFVRVPVTIKLSEKSTAFIIESEDDGTKVVGYIGGLETRLTEDVLRDAYIAVEGDGRIEVTLTKFDICGTGTEIKVIDNVTGEVVGVYYLVIYGDVNGDSDIDATDVAMIEDEALGITAWSVNLARNASYDRSKVLACDMNSDGTVTFNDAERLTYVTLFLAEIDQQTGEIIEY